MDYGNNETVVSPDLIQTSGQKDQSYGTALINSIEHRFPNRCFLTKSEIHDF